MAAATSPAARPSVRRDGTTLSLALGDVNGDAAPDIVAGDETHGVVYLNNGKGVFYSGPVDDCAASPTDFGCFGASRTDAVALADVNGDGTLDIVAGNNLSADEGTQSAVYLNNGAGVSPRPSRATAPCLRTRTCCGASGATTRPL